MFLLRSSAEPKGFYIHLTTRRQLMSPHGCLANNPICTPARRSARRPRVFSVQVPLVGPIFRIAPGSCHAVLKSCTPCEDRVSPLRGLVHPCCSWACSPQTVGASKSPATPAVSRSVSVLVDRPVSPGAARNSARPGLRPARFFPGALARWTETARVEASTRALRPFSFRGRHFQLRAFREAGSVVVYKYISSSF